MLHGEPAEKHEHAEAQPADETAIEDEAAVEAEDTEGPTVTELVGEGEHEQELAAEHSADHAEVPSPAEPGRIGGSCRFRKFATARRRRRGRTKHPLRSRRPPVGPLRPQSRRPRPSTPTTFRKFPSVTTAARTAKTTKPPRRSSVSVGGADALEEVPDRAPRYRRQYKIQEVIKRRQVMLVQVVKEERGTKGAALTTYLSLAGRYSVLMPNTARGGGISRKITSGEDRSRLKEIAQELEVPEGMGVIVRTAGASRTKTEIKRDFEYLLRLWETVRDLTLKSTAPKLVYEEGSLVETLDGRPLFQGNRRGDRRRPGGLQRGRRSSCACSCRVMPRT